MTFNSLVWVPKNIQQRIVEWYHSNLQHARINRTINSIGQTLTWKGLSTMVEKHISTCDSCQQNKRTNKKAYGKIPLTSALRDKQPWEVVHVDCCGPWKIRWHDDKSGRIHSFEIHLLSMVDACTAWSEFCHIKMASSLATSSGFDKNWLCRYPRPRKVVHNNGNEFMGYKFQELLDSYGIKSETYDGKKSNCECNRGMNPWYSWRATPGNNLWCRLEQQRRHAYSGMPICSLCNYLEAYTSQHS